jgi:replicative DNA helicase
MVAIPGGKAETPVSGGFKSFPDRCNGERGRRLEIGKRKLSFGVSFLDASLGGIFPNDVILIGAKTGRGKTQLASIISQSNAMKGKRVHYFALEAEEDEIERRAKFSVLYETVRQTCTQMRGGYERVDRMNYLDWYAGDLEDVTAPLEDLAQQVVEKRFRTLNTFYRTKDFYASHFESLVREVENDTDLIVLDHLHYVDSDEENENKGYKEIVKRIRDLAITFSRPIVVVAHLRKSERRNAALVPNEEDFHGTSDVPKMATKAIILAEDKTTDTGDPCLWSTFIAPVKCRLDGSRARYVGRVNFDIRSGRYVDEFETGSIVGDKFEITDNRKLPRWAKP